MTGQAPAARGAPPRRRRGPLGPLCARDAALAVLHAVAERDAYANLVLPGVLAASALDRRDRALATELAYGTLRWQGSLDRLLALCLTRPLEAVDPVLLPVLRLGAYQLWRTRVPARAAVSTAVEQARAAGAGPATGLVNAVLRGVARRLAGADPLQLASVEDPWERLGLELAHPRWVVDRFAQALDGDPDQTRAALAADNASPAVHLVARPDRLDRDELLRQAGPRGRATRWSPYGVVLGGGDPAGLPAVRAGLARVQDEASQLVALALHRVAPPGLLVDLCAGPGGKADLLSGLAPHRPVVALDVAARRAGLTRRSGVGAVAQADGRRPPLPPGCAAAVLVDAPCTGLGALRRRPEARWRRRPEDLPALLAAQRALLDAALRLVRPGGVVGYVVCSPVLAEAEPGELAGTTRLDACAAAGLAAHEQAEAGRGRLQLWPHRHGTDALSLVLLRREDGAHG